MNLLLRILYGDFMRRSDFRLKRGINMFLFKKNNEHNFLESVFLKCRHRVRGILKWAICLSVGTFSC